MTNRIAITALVLLGATCVALMANGQRRASKPAYKVEQFEIKSLRANNSQIFEQKLNDLAAQGWEYVGPVSRASYVFVTNDEDRGQKDSFWIAFKRNSN